MTEGPLENPVTDEAPWTKSKDGYLALGEGEVDGAHPELGDKVYDAGGKELGEIEFFGNQLDAVTWLVKVSSVDEDPLLVRAEQEPHENKSDVQAWWLRAYPGAAAAVKPAAAPRVVIQNNVSE